jgi:hypothetical protein
LLPAGRVHLLGDGGPPVRSPAIPEQTSRGVAKSVAGEHQQPSRSTPEPHRSSHQRSGFFFLSPSPPNDGSALSSSSVVVIPRQTACTEARRAFRLVHGQSVTNHSSILRTGAARSVRRSPLGEKKRSRKQAHRARKMREGQSGGNSGR